MTNRYKVVRKNTLFYIFDNEKNRVIDSVFLYKSAADAVCEYLNRKAKENER